MKGAPRPAAAPLPRPGARPLSAEQDALAEALAEWLVARYRTTRGDGGGQGVASPNGTNRAGGLYTPGEGEAA